MRPPSRRARRRAGVALVVAVALLATAPAGATAPARSPRVVGGTVAAPGAWPSQVAVLLASIGDPYAAQFCGGTLVGARWVLTAAHCVDPARRPQSDQPQEVDVLVGTQTLSSGGTRIPVEAIRRLPGYVSATFERDAALLRLAAPAGAPAQALAAPGAPLAAGTAVTATGWGSTFEGGARVDDLREVTVAAVADGSCSSAYGPDFVASSMVCAGAAGKDACQGDSGGPLVTLQGGTWVQVGITSWGEGCAAPGFPGVYTRVAAVRSWVDQVVTYWPHASPNALVDRTHRDLFDRPPTDVELYTGVVDLNGGTTPARYVSDLVGGTTYQGRTGGVTRLYRAFFLRDPDTPGLVYWWGGVNHGRSLHRIANIMAASAEFRDRYGALDDGAYVDLVYQNVLGRAADAPGRAFWVGELASGRRTRGQVMVGFSESSENKGLTGPRVAVITTWFGLLHRVPTGPEVAGAVGTDREVLVGELLGSTEYAARS